MTTTSTPAPMGGLRGAGSHDVPDSTADDYALLPGVASVAQDAGARLLDIFSIDSRPADRAELAEAGHRNENTSLAGMRAALHELRPGTGWVEEDQETTELPPGEWWCVDAVEGNVNHVHGLPEWCVSITLLREQAPVLTVVHQPVGDATFTAVRGTGAFLNGRRLQVSAKTDLTAGIVATGQAEAGQVSTHRRIGESITAMLGEALLVRATVPSTFPMLLVASGQVDAFWQYQPVLPGIAAGILLATEAGGIATRIDGSPWHPGSPDVLVAGPAIHARAAAVLTTVA